MNDTIITMPLLSTIDSKDKEEIRLDLIRCLVNIHDTYNNRSNHKVFEMKMQKYSDMANQMAQAWYREHINHTLEHYIAETFVIASNSLKINKPNKKMKSMTLWRYPFDDFMSTQIDKLCMYDAFNNEQMDFFKKHRNPFTNLLKNSGVSIEMFSLNCLSFVVGLCKIKNILAYKHIINILNYHLQHGNTKNFLFP